MTAHDCFELGRNVYEHGDYENSVLWLNEAHERLKNNTETPLYADTLDYLAFVNYQLGKS